MPCLKLSPIDTMHTICMVWDSREHIPLDFSCPARSINDQQTCHGIVGGPSTSMTPLSHMTSFLHSNILWDPATHVNPTTFSMHKLRLTIPSSKLGQKQLYTLATCNSRPLLTGGNNELNRGPYTIILHVMHSYMHDYITCMLCALPIFCVMHTCNLLLCNLIVFLDINDNNANNLFLWHWCQHNCRPHSYQFVPLWQQWQRMKQPTINCAWTPLLIFYRNDWKF